MADISVSAQVWPEDTGTGTADGNEDFDSAGYISGMQAQGNSSDYVEAGLGFTVDYTTPAFDLAAGLAYVKFLGSIPIQLPSDDHSTYSGSWDHGATFAVQVQAQTGISLTDSAINYIYLDVDLGANDTVSLHIDTDQTPPTEPYLKIGEIDTTNDVASELNRAPSADFNTVSLAELIDASGVSHTGELADSADLYTDEQAQDAVGGILDADFVYDDAGNLISLASVLGVDIDGDADTVDGSHASAFADSGHAHAHSEITNTGSGDHHTRYANSEARSAIEAGDLAQIDGVNNFRIRFDGSTDYVELTDQSNSRTDLVTNDIYANGTWFSGHEPDNSAHHTRYSDSEARSAVDNSDVTVSGLVLPVGTDQWVS